MSGDATHWYTKDRQPAHEAKLKEARQYGLLPSPTSIEMILHNFGISLWKEQELMKACGAALFAGYYKGWEDDALKVVSKNRKATLRAGTKAHEQIAKCLTTGEAPDDKYALQAISFLQDIESKQEMVEVIAVTDLYGCTIDLIIKHGERSYTIIDWKVKTTDSEAKQYPAHRRQLAAYKMAAEHSGLVKGHVDLMNIFLTDDEPVVAKLSNEDFNQAWLSFQALLNFYLVEKKLIGGG